MSNSRGRVHFADKYVMHGKYVGASDVFLDMVFPTQRHADSAWDNFGFVECKCGKDEPCTLYSEYGEGFAWKGRACRHCGAVTGGSMPFEDDDTEHVAPGLIGEE